MRNWASTNGDVLWALATTKARQIRQIRYLDREGSKRFFFMCGLYDCSSTYEGQNSGITDAEYEAAIHTQLVDLCVDLQQEKRAQVPV